MDTRCPSGYLHLSYKKRGCTDNIAPTIMAKQSFKLHLIIGINGGFQSFNTYFTENIFLAGAMLNSICDGIIHIICTNILVTSMYVGLTNLDKRLQANQNQNGFLQFNC